jgi:uncharacterized protein with NAD-binding domain and iron-sulfur cluster
MPEPRPRRIVILGGGPAGLAAALSLTDPELHPNWREEYEVTVLQMGWRVGGKGAAGRRGHAVAADGEWRLQGDGRIEEHGIHLFGNMYVNSIRLLDRCLAELQRAPGEPVTSMATDLIPSNYMQLADYFDRSWHLTPQHLPHNDLHPWDAADYPPPDVLVAEILRTVIQLLEEAFGPDGGDEHRIRRHLGALRSLHEHHVAHPMLPVLHHHRGALDGIAALVADLVTLFEAGGERAALIRSVWCQTEMYLTVAKGVIADEIFTKGIDTVDGEDFLQWCRRHGMSDTVLYSSPVQMPAQMCFQFPSGDTTEDPNFSAAGFLWFVLRQLLACGQATYWFHRGTADTVIAPFYRVAVQRGVRFEFFHKVRALHLDESGFGIGRVDVDVQATTVDGAPYEPLVRLADGSFGWPNAPILGQLAQGAALAELGIDLESWWTPWQPVGRRQLRAGVDFDQLISAVPLPCLPLIAPEVVAVAPWHDAIDGLGGLPTIAAQLWTGPTTGELGFPRLPGTDRVSGGAAVPPLGFADMSDVLGTEQWPDDDAPRGLIYLCGPSSHRGPWPGFDQHDTPARAVLAAEATVLQWLRSAVSVVPGAGTNPVVPESFDMELLFCARDAGEVAGDDRLRRQYVRANIDPNERYVPSPPGSAALRPRAWESGFENLALASDWIFTGINIGSFEGAVMSGLLAAHAVSGLPALSAISGYDFARPAGSN